MCAAKAEELGLDRAGRDRRPRRGRRPGRDAADPAVARHPKACAREGIDPADLDLVEINEAFAAVGIVSTRELGIDPEKVNANGGAIALGHPVGMSGARIVLDLALELGRRGGGVGAAALCGGGGQGDALILRVPARRLGARGQTPPRRPAGRRGRRAADVRPGRARPRRRARVGGPADLAGRGRQPAAARGRGGARAAHRSGPSSGSPGRPGVGKSTTTAALVRRSGRPGKRVGVLAVDPSSPFSGGALLGDRVRMQDHAGDGGVYIRSMASRGHLGGLAWATPQALRVLDAAGCDVVLVETVGVGQSELEVASLADTTLVLLAPGDGRRDPGGEGRDPRGGRRLRRQQGRPGRRRPDRARPAGDAGRWVAGTPRPGVAPADREDRRLPRDRQRRGGGRRPDRASTRRGWTPPVRGTDGAVERAAREVEAIAVAGLRERMGDVHGSAALGALAGRWSRGRPTPTARRTSCVAQL